MCFLAASLFGAIPGRENPVPVRTVTPEYPSDMKHEGISGIVTVKCSIDVQGNVSDASVVKSTNGAFDKNALAAVKKWKFKPARQDGNPVAVDVTIPIKFVAEQS